MREREHAREWGKEQREREKQTPYQAWTLMQDFHLMGDHNLSQN